MAVDIATRWRDERRPETSKGSCGVRRPDARLRAIAAAPGLVALSVFGAAFGERPAPASAIALTGAVSPDLQAHAARLWRGPGRALGPGREPAFQSPRVLPAITTRSAGRRGCRSGPGMLSARLIRDAARRAVREDDPLARDAVDQAGRVRRSGERLADSGGHRNSSGPISSIGF